MPRLLHSFVLFVLFILTLETGSYPHGPAGTAGNLQAFDIRAQSLGLCPLINTDVRARVSGILARVTVTQRFHNPFIDPIEAVYTFPLPHEAAVDEMTVRTGDRTIRGVIRRRKDAAKLYEEARVRGVEACPSCGAHLS
jgi:Ca-activated chloride channel homolog